MPKTELFVGNLGRVSKEDMEHVFKKYGPLTKCEIKDKGKHPFTCTPDLKENMLLAT